MRGPAEGPAPQGEKFPKGYKFTLGDRIVAAALDVFELLVQAAYSRDKGRLLERANMRLEALKHLLRLARRVGPLPNKGYEHVSVLVTDLGRQVGGWRRHIGRRDGQDAPESVP